MLNYKIYKLFNPELSNLNNNQLLFHWKNLGTKENKICSIEQFFKLYPYYDHNQYKLYNIDLKIDDKFELMKHWHNLGNKENRICSDKYFQSLYPNVNINDLNIFNFNIYEFKNKYHQKYINSEKNSNIITNSFNSIPENNSLYLIIFDKFTMNEDNKEN